MFPKRRHLFAHYMPDVFAYNVFPFQVVDYINFFCLNVIGIVLHAKSEDKQVRS